MEYAELVSVYEDLEETAATLEKTEILAELFDTADSDHLPIVVKLARGNVFANWESSDLGVSTALTLDAIEKATGVDTDQIEEWWREEGDIGDAAARAVAEKAQQTLFSEPLTVRDVYSTLHALASYEGSGSQSRRVDEIAGLLTSATPPEARYVVRTITGAMRLGVGEGIVRDAIAWTFLDESEASIRAVERAFEVTNDYSIVAERARRGGEEALAGLEMELFRPIKPMLAQNADSLAEAIADLGDSEGTLLFETKYDGIRAKLHGDGNDVRLFTRRLEDVTSQFPDVIDAVTDAVSADSFIIEGELVGYEPSTGDPVPFQTLSQRIKRKYDVESIADEIPVTLYVFDLVYLDDESLLESPLRDRLAGLETVFDAIERDIQRADHVQTGDLQTAETFYEAAVANGHEGVMAKNLDAPYRPGSRVGYQLKVKSTMEPLDLVVTRAKWSEGRKSGYLGRPYLACRDESDGSFLEVGRMHTGFTDEQLETFTDLVEPLILEIDGREAVFRPAVVLEVEYEEIQKSPKYDSGFALRFPRLSRIRHDLEPADVDTFDTIATLYEEQ